jgi:hypothetical protein
MSIAEAGLRSLRGEFEAFNSKHGRIGVVLLCELTFPLLDGSGKVAPSTGKWHLDSPGFRRPPEFPTRSQRDGVTFASGAVRDGLIRLPPCCEDSKPSSDSPDGVFATSDGRLLIPDVEPNDQRLSWWSTGSRFELQYFVQGPPKSLAEFIKLEASALKLLRALIDLQKLLQWSDPTTKAAISKGSGSHLWVELLFWLNHHPEISLPFVSERRIASATVPSSLHRKWSTLPQRTKHSKPISYDAVPRCWYAVLSDVATASAFMIDAVLAALPQMNEKSLDVPSETEIVAQDDHLERMCNIVGSKRNQAIVRYLWGRKRATDIRTLIDVCWNGKDVQTESAERQIRRINEIAADFLQISIRNERVTMDVFPK